MQRQALLQPGVVSAGLMSLVGAGLATGLAQSLTGRDVRLA